MAHELNNPLTSIRMFAQMVAEGMPPGSPFREHAGVIVRNTETCRHTIQTLLGYATTTPPASTELAVHDVVEDVRQFVRPIAQRAGAGLVLRLDAPRDDVVGDEIQLRQLLTNLVLNAVQAGGDEPVEVAIETRNAGDVLEVAVEDDGPGVPPELRERVFDAFFSTKPHGEGTGLGLPTARRIAELHGGGLELVRSDAGGTRFVVRLPTAAVRRPSTEPVTP